MLIKEYRIILPMTVEEYKIAQLYMILKKSRNESKGAGAGVEIIENKPYTNGYGGNGQYTYKIYHVESKIPSWIRAILPIPKFPAIEEAWNAYPLTKTKYSCPFVDRLSVEVETHYFNDPGDQENVFNLSKEDLKNRIVDVMDFVNDPIGSHDYLVEEDPVIYRSKKTGRGPLSKTWIQDYIKNGLPIMCAYKLCKVEFKYWGMQTRVEKWIHDLALRNTMNLAHRQAWAWQDEWIGLTMEDIRRLEEETKAHLKKVMNEINENEKVNESNIDWETTSSSDIFYDCPDHFSTHSLGNPKQSLVRWNSELMVSDEQTRSYNSSNDSNSQEKESYKTISNDSESNLLILIFHYTSMNDDITELKASDSETFKSVIDQLILQHYPKLKKKVIVRQVKCGNALNPLISKISKLSPHFGAFHPSMALLMMNYGIEYYYEAIKDTVTQANNIYKEILNEIGETSFNGDIFVVGDCISGILLYGILVDDIKFNRNDSIVMSKTTPKSSIVQKGSFRSNQLDIDQESLFSTWESDCSSDMIMTIRPEFDFHIHSTFLLGCPLALILMQRNSENNYMGKLNCNQLYNLYYPLDPCAVRIEPVLNSQLSLLPPVNLPRYQKFPFGDGKHIEFDSTTIECSLLWGDYRVDHQLYCPPEMSSLPSSALPNILQASYWESKDVASFLLRQFAKTNDIPLTAMRNTLLSHQLSITSLDLPKQQWSRRRTKYKVANLVANHRGNDVICIEGKDQCISARFCYGPMDLVALSREMIAIYYCTEGGEWAHHGNQLTDNHGRLMFNFDKSEKLPVGRHQIKMIVIGDYTYLDLYLIVARNGSPCVIFSIDGSLTCSVSVTGRDPRVRPGCVDVVRYWQRLNYLIIYITARPDMQQKVVSCWMSKHNFPHGLIFFNHCISTDPLRQKSLQILNLIDIGLKIHAAYGSGKDVSVYGNAGCINIDSGYHEHLKDLESGKIMLAKPVFEKRVLEDHEGLVLESVARDFTHTYTTFSRRSGKFGAVN
uniref:DDHD domain-containing protein n=1 Tax=Parastrongyloides trichosuri TaxID=131310 RepID=A0A0N4ZNB4_PARTI